MGSTKLVSELHGKPLLKSSLGLLERFNETIALYPNHLALACTHQSPNSYGIESIELDDSEYTKHPYLRWSYNNLKHGVDRLSAAIARLGVRKGTPFFTFIGNTVEYVLAMWAAHQLGCIHVPLNARILLNHTETKHMVQAVIDHQQAASAIVLTADPEIARQFDDLLLTFACIKIVVGKERGGWIPLADLMMGPDDDKYLSTQAISESASPQTAVFFTSGTTSLPKGCLTNCSDWITSLDSSLESTSKGDITVLAVLNNHAFGYICQMIALTRGAAIVFPSDTFSAQTLMDATSMESCTHVSLVPAMVHAFKGVRPSNRKRIKSLKRVTFAGMLLQPEVLQYCLDDLGVSQVENYYGMTEGAFATTGYIRDVEDLFNGNEVAIGTPSRGSKIRICAPGTKTPLPRDSPGELHFSGNAVVKNYIGRNTNDFYMGDDGCQWFITGDQAVISDEGKLYIAGRYKDIIIRAGENISPAAIESLLSQNSNVYALNPQVVGVSDPIAGEVPVIVTNRKVDDKTQRLIHDMILAKLGPIYIPDDILSVQSLGLQDYPRTTLGKVQKNKLVALVGNYRQEPKSNELNGDIRYSSFAHTVKRVWARIVGLDINDIDIHTRINNFADSINLLRARDKLTKETGRGISLAEWTAADTIGAQIELLRQVEPNHTHTSDQHQQRMGPPNASDMVHLTDNPELLSVTITLVEETISPFGLCWDDVQDIMPTTDFVQTICRTKLVNTWNIRTSVLANNADSKQMRAAIETTLRFHPVMLSFIVVDTLKIGADLGLYVTMRQSQKLLDQCILDLGTVETMDDVRDVTMNYPYKDHAMLPGPLFRAIIVFVKEKNSAAIILNGSFSKFKKNLVKYTNEYYLVAHAILDATYYTMFNEDLDTALSGQLPTPHLSFKVWADSYYTLRKSPAARAAVDYNKIQLREMLRHEHALWPLSTPGLEVAPERAPIDGYVTTFPLHISPLREAYPALTMPVVLKAATVLLSIYHTGHTHALFANLEAVRARFPFVPNSFSSLGSFDGANVGGPTFTCIMNLIPFRPQEPVVEFLHRIQATQVDQVKHASAPWHEIMRELGPGAEALLPQTADSLLFNWMPGLGAMTLGASPYASMAVTQTHIRTKIGMLLNAGMAGKDGSQVVLLLQGAIANMSTERVTAAAEGIKRIATWLVDEASWEGPVGGFRQCFE